MENQHVGVGMLLVFLHDQINNRDKRGIFYLTEEGTVLYELLQVVRVTSQLEDECGSSDLLLDVLIQQLHILIDAADARLLVQLKGNKPVQPQDWKSPQHCIYTHIYCAVKTQM